MTWLVLGSLLPSFALALAGGWLARRICPWLGLMDQPGTRKIHAAPVPTGGGLAVWLAVILPFALGQLTLWLLVRSDSPPPAWIPAFVAPHLSGLWEQSGRLWIMLAGGTVLMLLGLADDRRGLDWRFRLAVQTAVAATMVALGWRLTVFLDVPWLTAVLSVLWIVGLVNSFNMLDNMDGLSAGVAGIGAAMLGAVMLLAPDPTTSQPQLFVGGFLLVLVGALTGFLWHNRPPARLFLGDAGAYFIGYLLAMCTLMATFSGGSVPRHAILAPLCVLAVPLYDTASVVLIRLRQGRSPFHADKSHFSHRLVELGMTTRQAVLTIYLATATCGLGALLLHQVSAGGACIVLLMVACVLLLVAILEHAGHRDHGRNGKRKKR